MRVELPDGRILEDVPEGTTKAQLAAKLRANGISFDEPASEPPRRRSAAAPGESAGAPERTAQVPLEQAPALLRGAVGAGRAVTNAARGVGSLVGVMAPQDELEKQMRRANEEQTGTAGTIGEIAGDVGMSALPMGAVARGVRALPRAARAAADVAANAAYSAATAPEDRGMAALYGGGGALAGRGLNRVASGLVRPSADAQALMDRGVRLSPGQAGEGLMGAAAEQYERALGAVPGLGRFMRNARQQGVEDWNRSLMTPGAIDRAAPVGAEGIEELGERVGARYREALPEGVPLKLDDQAAGIYDDTVLRLGKTVAPSARGKFHEVAEWVGENLKEGVDASQFKESITNELRAATKKAFKDGDHSLAVALQKLDTDVVGALPHFPNMPAAAEGLPAIDKAYREFKVLKKTGEKLAAQQRGHFYPNELLGPATRGSERLQSEALKATPMFGPPASGMDKVMNLGRLAAIGFGGHALVGAPLAGTAAVVSLLGTTPMGRRFLLGQVPWQAVVKAHPEVAAQVGRALAEQKAQ